MKSFAVSTLINASPDLVWGILCDAARWIEWNPTIAKIEGNIAPGGAVKLFTKDSPDRAFPLRVSLFEPPRRMVWTGGMPLGLFKGERTYTLMPTNGGASVDFAMREVFSGLMAPLITRSIPDLQPSFDAFAVALKARAERPA